jgi:YHS domain-containing protein
MFRIFTRIGLAAVAMAAMLSLHAQNTPTRQQQYNLSDKQLALEGYDPVAYFTAGKATKGSASLAVVHEGVRYHFASEQNKNLFKANPAKYEPQYGGWCAYAMGATGEKVSIDPETFKITNGKLYLFYHSWTNNTLPKWNKEEAFYKNLQVNNRIK